MNKLRRVLIRIAFRISSFMHPTPDFYGSHEEYARARTEHFEKWRKRGAF